METAIQVVAYTVSFHDAVHWSGYATIALCRLFRAFEHRLVSNYRMNVARCTLGRMRLTENKCLHVADAELVAAS